MGFSRLTKVAIGFGSLLILSGIIGSIVYSITGESNELNLYDVMSSNLNDGSTKNTARPKSMLRSLPLLPKICQTQQCDAIALDIKTKMNESVQPCDNFFEFVCGNSNFSEGFWTSSSNFEELKIHHLNALMDVIENMNNTYQEELFKRSFNLCLDTEERDKLGLSVIKKALEKVNLTVFPNILMGKTANQFDWLNIVLNIKHSFNIDLIFGMNVVKNVLSIENNILTVETPKLRGCMGFKENICKKLVVNEDVIKYVINKFATEENYKIEKDLLEEAVFNIRIVHNSIEEKQKSVQSTVCDLEIVQHLPILPNITEEFLLRMKLKDRQGILLSVDNKEYLQQVFEYVSGIDLKNLEVYIWWRFVFNWLMFTSSDITEFLVKKIEDEDFQFPSKSFQCAFLFYETLPGISRNLLKRYGHIVNEEADTALIDELMGMVETIKDNLIANITASESLNQETKNFMISKLKNTTIYLKSPYFPGFLQTFGILDKISHLNVTFFDVLMGTKALEFPRIAQKIKNVPDKNVEIDDMFKVVTYFDSNAISIPLEFLKTPFYGLGLASLEFGALGVLIAEGLVKLIDSKGINFNEVGLYKKVWNCGNKNDTIFYTNALDLGFNSWDRFQGIQKNMLMLNQYGDDRHLFFISYSHLWCGSGNREPVMKLFNGSIAFRSVFCH